ncbi:MAG: hypothetical protein FJ035_07445 [Chloroflexi bacterium]|nr:hypothetical protein [Chloroflexota bacterium]
MLVVVCTPDPRAVEAVSRSLRNAGHATIATIAPERALAVARRAAATLDAVVLDAALGAEACITAAAELRALAPDVEVLVVGESAPAATPGYASATVAALMPHLHALASARAR